jgi:hypothetical protein
MWKKKLKKKEAKIQDSMGKTNLFIGHPALQSLGNVIFMAPFRSSSKIIRNLNLEPVSNIEIFPTRTKLELSVLCVTGKLVKDVIHMCKRNFEKINFCHLASCPNIKQPLLGSIKF